ncbi:MAG: hypothetical protein ACE148_12525 [Vicinamibacterales bacterium]
MHLVSLVTSLFLAGFGAAILPGVETSPQGPPGPVVTFEFRVVGEEGRPLLDLKPEELTVRVDGRTRELASLDLVRFAAPGPPAEGERPDPPQPPYFTNVPGETGRDLLILLDDESFRPGREQAVKDGLKMLVDALSPLDRVGLRRFPLGGEVVPLTRDRAALRDYISKLRGRAPASMSWLDVACRTRQMLSMLPDVLAGASRHIPLTVVLMTNGLATAQMQGPLAGTPSDLCEVRSRDFSDLELPALASRTFFHAVQVLEETGFGLVSLNELTAGLQHLNQVAGGHEIVRLSGGSPQAILRVLNESSAYYSAGFVPEPKSRNGRDHRLEVRVAREGAKVIVRPKVVIPDAETLGSFANEQGIAPLLIGRPRQELPLRAAAYTARDVNEALKVIAVFEPIEPSAAIQSAIVALFDETGRIRSQFTAKTGTFKMWPTSVALEARRGAFRLRVAAVDSAGRQGTVDVDFQADLTRAGPARLSDLMLAASEGGPLLPRLQFTTENVGVAFVEIYDVAKTSEVAVNFEVAGSLDGPALAAVPARVEAGGDSRTAVGAFAPSGLPAGDYVIRALVSVDGKPAGRVVTTLRKAGS